MNEPAPAQPALQRHVPGLGRVCEHDRLARTCSECDAAKDVAALQSRLADAEKALKAEREGSNPSADAIDVIWKDVLLKHRPFYGDWEYPMQVARHVIAECDDLRKALTAAEQQRDAALADNAELEKQHYADLAINEKLGMEKADAIAAKGAGEKRVKELEQAVATFTRNGFTGPQGKVQSVRYWKMCTRDPERGAAQLPGEIVMVLSAPDAALTPPAGERGQANG